MEKIVALVGLVLGLFVPLSVEACRDMVPDMTALQSYDSIFVGEVSGIRLIEYENRRLNRPGACESDLSEDGIECIDTIAGSPAINIFVIPIEVIKGAVSDVQELHQVGCTNSDIPLRERGIFFVNPGGSSAVIVWRFKSPDYTNWLKRLGVGQDGR